MLDQDHQLFSTSITTKKKKKKTQISRENEQEVEANKMVVFLEEGNGFAFSPFSVPPRSRSQATTRRVTPTPTQENILSTIGSGERKAAVVVEKALPNGDLYSGSFSGSVPHGTGKYLWSDGCMYEGEWRRGKAAGKGKFSWPSGATFEGEFKSGRMEGFGIFTGSDGDTYRGLWVANKKHGYGQKRYANGDSYEGGWRRNAQEGQGRYVWRNGNQYVGEWKNGIISGQGILIWSKGNRYDGQWENGVLKGGGVFTWPNGSCYVVNSSLMPQKCSNYQDKLQGTFYPSTSPSKSTPTMAPMRSSPLFSSSDLLDSHCLPKKRSSVDAAFGRQSYAEKNFPRICIWESDGEAGDITCDIVDTIEASMLYKDGIGKVVAVFEAEEGYRQKQQQRSPWCFIGGDLKKPGHTISKGHKNYVLMQNLQLGISYSVGKSMQMRDLKPSDFNPREKFWTRFPPKGSKIPPPHQSVEFRWKDYCPMVFRHLRKLFAVDSADYMLAICGNKALRELSSPGKSGSFFYLTQDDRFMIKTVRKSEVKVLIRMLPNYYGHVSQHHNSLVTKFFGVHCVKPAGGQKVRFIVMGNLFCSEHQIHRRFDLKGSSYGRTAAKTDGKIDETTTLKDLDLNFVFRIQQPCFQDLLRQIDLDCQFLEAEGIMDYSLLIGLHFCDYALASKLGLLSSPTSPEDIHETHVPEAGIQDVGSLSGDRKPAVQLGASMLARAEVVSRIESLTPGQRGDDIYEAVLYFGIIDILQDYDISKKLEHAYKSLHVDPNSISAVEPKLYSKRFRDFIKRIFIEDG